jgi:hypothetical protein
MMKKIVTMRPIMSMVLFSVEMDGAGQVRLVQREQGRRDGVRRQHEAVEVSSRARALEVGGDARVRRALDDVCALELLAGEVLALLARRDVRRAYVVVLASAMMSDV